MALQIHSRKLKASFVVLAVWAVAAPAFADTLTGLWRGEYTCGQGLTAMALSLREDARGNVQAVMTFSEHPKNPGVPTGCFTLFGRYNARSGALLLKQQKWLKQPDPYWYMIDLGGKISADGNSYAGSVVFPQDGLCSSFSVKRVSRALPPAPSAKDCDSEALVS
ncbi:MAG TPA: hypothetical protein VG735_07425 [Caulobacterales bacterium]|nr:hypothetical protein [Caulobacterales bacterium]